MSLGWAENILKTTASSRIHSIQKLNDSYNDLRGSIVENYLFY